jgi:hypothetical protein
VWINTGFPKVLKRVKIYKEIKIKRMISFETKGTYEKNKNIMTSKKLERQKCEIYSRVVGYLSPIHRWNKGKRAEFDDRKEYDQMISDVQK